MQFAIHSVFIKFIDYTLIELSIDNCIHEIWLCVICIIELNDYIHILEKFSNMEQIFCTRIMSRGKVFVKTQPQLYLYLFIITWKEFFAQKLTTYGNASTTHEP